MPKVSQNTKAPLLSQNCHDGIIERFEDDANNAKAIIYANKKGETLPNRKDRELPVLPPDITRSEFNKAIEEISILLGKENISILDEKVLDDGWYLEHPIGHDAFHILDQDDLVASAVFRPSLTEEVEVIVKWANKHKIPLHPISLGRNFGYGGSAPRVRGSVVLDLGNRMNKILDFDAKNGTLMVEPGVTYYALYDFVKKSGAPFLIDTTDIGGGSVMGNALDRGLGYTPYGDHYGMHCGMEVVLPTGEVIRTGMGALPESTTWNLFPYGFGPFIDGLFSQSNYGIVTRMGLWLMPDPGGDLTYLVTVPKYEDIGQISASIQKLRMQGLIQNVPHMHNAMEEVAAIGKPRDHYWKGKGVMPDHEIAKLLKDTPTGANAWYFYGTVYGPPEVQEVQIKKIKEEFLKIKGAQYFAAHELPEDHYCQSRALINSGIPHIKELDWVNWMPNGSHLFFTPICPITLEHSSRLMDICKRRHDEFGIDLCVNFLVCPREIHVIVQIVYDKFDQEHKRNAHELLDVLITDCAKEGFGEYRTHVAFQDRVMQTFNWNNGSLLKLYEQLKDALDPNGILAPGKSGIWPKNLRGRGFEITKPTNRSDPSDKLSRI
ncbi:unnamed protein product [Debaryomyces tyrocola]|nr:unnamed protein product [Debaryomyces tyrocola]